MNRAAPTLAVRRQHCGQFFLAAAAFLVVAVSTGGTQQQPRDPSRLGQDLAKRVLQAQDTSGFRVRGRVIIGTEREGDPGPLILQVRIVGRRENSATRVLYQILWPTSLKGHAAVLERRQAPGIEGFLFEPPDRVTRMTPALALTPFAGSALTYEDLAENFWRWPRQRIAGPGRSGAQGCTILESRSPSETASEYSLVRSCIASKRSTPLWIEKLGGDGKVIKRIAFEAPEGKNQDFRMAMIVEGSDPARRTRIEFVRSERGLTISPDEFSVGRLKALAISRP